jgi:hypothetical protein
MKKFEDIKSVVTSIARATPMIAGALGGIFLHPEKGWNSVYTELKHGNGEAALQSAVASYTFFNYQSEGFSGSAGTGVKTLAAGGVVSKLLSWMLD